MADFTQALQWLKEGKKVRLSNWSNPRFIWLDVDIIRYHDNDWYTPSYGSLISNEWIQHDDEF